jgi:hypothetical protein
MRPPEVVVPPVGVAGRVTLLSLGPKQGKTTTACGMIAEASTRGIRCGMVQLDEALADTVQRLRRFEADLGSVWLGDAHDADLGSEVRAHDIEFLAIDHLSKIAERHPGFGAGSQGDPLLWGQLVAPFCGIAREQGTSILLLDQARRSDNKYTGSFAKAAGVDVLCEVHPRDGALTCTPGGRIYLPPFTVTLIAGKPTFSEVGVAGRGDRISEAELAEALLLLQSAEPEGFKSTPWSHLVCDQLKVSPRTYYRIRRTLYTEGLVSYASRIYRVSPTGARWLAKRNGRVAVGCLK